MTVIVKKLENIFLDLARPNDLLWKYQPSQAMLVWSMTGDQPLLWALLLCHQMIHKNKEKNKSNKILKKKNTENLNAWCALSGQKY